jgi:hypothetical protein
MSVLTSGNVPLPIVGSGDVGPVVVDPEAPVGEVFVGSDGCEFIVPFEWIDSVVEQVSSRDVRAAALAPNAVAGAMLACGPGARREVIEKQAVREVRRKLVIWNLATPETFVRIGVLRGYSYLPVRHHPSRIPRRAGRRVTRRARPRLASRPVAGPTRP